MRLVAVKTRNVFFIVPLQSEVEETLKRIESHKGVIGTLVVNADGKSANKSCWVFFFCRVKALSSLFRYSHQDHIGQLHSCSVCGPPVPAGAEGPEHRPGH